MNQVVSIYKIAELIGVKPSWVKSMVFQKKIPFIKLGKHVRFDTEEIQRWIEEKKIQEEQWN